MLNELIHPGQWFNRHLFLAGRRSVVWRTLSFVWSVMSAPVELSTRYTTADIIIVIIIVFAKRRRQNRTYTVGSIDRTARPHTAL